MFNNETDTYSISFDKLRNKLIEIQSENAKLSNQILYYESYSVIGKEAEKLDYRIDNFYESH